MKILPLLFLMTVSFSAHANLEVVLWNWSNQDIGTGKKVARSLRNSSEVNNLIGNCRDNSIRFEDLTVFLEIKNGVDVDFDSGTSERTKAVEIRMDAPVGTVLRATSGVSKKGIELNFLQTLRAICE